MGTPWRRFLTPARCGQTTSRIARPNSDDDGSGSPSLWDVTCASGTQLHVGAGERRVVTTGSAASNDARWAIAIGAPIRTDCGASTWLRHTIGGSWRKSNGTRKRSHSERPPVVPMPRLVAARRKAGCGRAGTAHFCGDAELPQRDFDLTPGPGGPAGFQRQDGIGRRSLGKGRRVRSVIPAWRGQRTATNQNGAAHHGRHGAHCRPGRRSLSTGK